MESTFAPCGKLKDIGTSTSTSSFSRSPSVPPSFARRSARSVRERSTRMGSTMKRLDVTNAVTERVLRERDHPPVADRRQRGHEPREQPEGQQAGEDGVGEHEPLQPLELLELHGAGGVPGDREDAERGEPGEQAPHASHGLVEHVQGLEERLLAGQRHEAHAGEHGEDDHRRDHVVGEGAEGVGRDVEVEPVDGALGLEAREGEEGASLPGGEREGEQEHEAEREPPERDEQEAAAAGQEAGVLALHAAEAGDQGAGHVGQDGDLEGLDEGAAADLQEGDLVAEEEADRDAGDEGERGSASRGSRARV